MRAAIVLALLLSLAAAAGEEDEIITGCHYSNAEWGMDAIDRCIRDNQQNRAAVLAYPPQHKRLVNRCRQFNEYGWDFVKACVDRDIEAEAALAQYPAEQAQQLAACQEQFGGRGAAAVRACVDKTPMPPSPMQAPKQE